jgi:hypothetical protein
VKRGAFAIAGDPKNGNPVPDRLTSEIEIRGSHGTHPRRDREMLEVTPSGRFHPGSTDEPSSPTARPPASGARSA